jgi:phospholipid transport system substrate-binding protein
MGQNWKMCFFKEGLFAMFCLKRDSLVRSRFIGVLLMVALLPAMVLADTPEEPEAIVQALSEQLRDALERDRERIKEDEGHIFALANEILAPHVDFDQVSSLALGKHWRRATPEQKAEFIHQFQRLLVRTYATAFHEFGEWSIRFLPRHEEEDRARVVVKTEVTRPGAPPASVNYRMQYKDGTWKAYDVVVEGISLVTNYRSSFSKEVRQGGIAGLISRITTLNDKRLVAQAETSS